MTFTIAFDFPEGGDPWFAARLSTGMGFTATLEDCARFDSEEIAQRVLENGYGPQTRSCGAVVEVEQ